MTKVSIITRTKDRPLFLERAFHSVSSQKFKSFEWIIVNDGGDPIRIEEIALRASQAGIKTKLIHNSSSLGMEAASNVGIRASSGEYLLVHDDDDSLHSSFLKMTSNRLDCNPNAAGVISWTVEIMEVFNGSNIDIHYRRGFVFQLASLKFEDLIVQNKFPPISFLFRRRIYDEIGGFDENLQVLGDWDFNLKLIKLGSIDVIKRRLANYHIRRGVEGVAANTITRDKIKHESGLTEVRERHSEDRLNLDLSSYNKIRRTYDLKSRWLNFMKLL